MYEIHNKLIKIYVERLKRKSRRPKLMSLIAASKFYKITYEILKISLFMI